MSSPALASSSFADRLAALSSADRLLCGLLIGFALFALTLGIGYGVAMALARSGVLSFLPDTPYRILTLHGTSAFFYWLFIAQAALLIVLAAGETGRGIALRTFAWIGTVLIAAGFVLSELSALTGTPLLYDANPELGLDDPQVVAGMAGGYLLLAAGLTAISVSGIATILVGPRKVADGFSALGFGLFALAGFLIVSAVAAVNAFLPNLLWALGYAAFPKDATTEWHILFHNLHYLPLMATVLVWYALARNLTGAQSITGAAFSKVVFASYLVFVPPTSLYHMFLEPNLPESMRVAGSLLSLFVSVPTLIAFLIVVASLEAHARANGATGLFGWIRRLPWTNPVIANMGVAMLTMLIGLVFAFVLIQEKLAPLLSDTVFVPGYFHFFAVGTITQTFLAVMMVALPAISGRALWRPAVLSRMPWIVLTGLLLFGVGGIVAGFLGVPRRVVDIGYDGAAPALWRPLMALLGVGGVVFAAGLSVSLYGVARSLIPSRKPASARAGQSVAWTITGATGAPAWTGPVAVLTMVVAMYGATIVAFELMQALPVAASGSSSH
ncbi:MAG: cbb3-type cytochrome c oxidase subunit I [Pseudolabrys sp.]|nr:cbb3-type cytochrome c oxidase subunit I [Pseudolabrys sp.]MDP2296774.1 cbb3-type cytochrome c oxidase subunit I [Pseudolabrys sp.]